MVYKPDFSPIARPGQLLALLGLSENTPRAFYRVIQVEAVPTISVNISASANNERQTALEVPAGVLVQWRFKVTVSGAQVVVRRPQSAVSWSTSGGFGFVSSDTDTDWGGTGAMRASTEFFFLGGTNDIVSFNNLTATAATGTRFSGWKYYLEPVERWLMQNPKYGMPGEPQFLEVELAKVPPHALSLLVDFAGIVPLYLSR